MTGMYNILEILPHKTPLAIKREEVHGQGLLSVLREPHDNPDRAVFTAYSWDDLAEKLVGRPGATTPWPEKPEDQLEAEEELLQRPVALKQQRAAEEANGKIRWLRPGYQAPEQTATQGDLPIGNAKSINKHTSKQANQQTKLVWPRTLQGQIRAVRSELAASPMFAEFLATRFRSNPLKSISEVLDALTELDMAFKDGDHHSRNE